MSDGGKDASGNGTDERRRVVYCLIPAELAGKLHEVLRAHFLEDREVTVVVERRGRERRRAIERRAPGNGSPRGEERRRVRNEAGRRVAERRAPQLTAEAPELPRRFRRYADQINFVERLAPSTEAAENAESTRLALSAQTGSPAAFRELYLRFFDPVYAYMKAALADAHEAEDKTQEVFMKLLQALPNYQAQAGTPFRGWLFRIVRNEAISHMRKHGRVEVEEPARIDRRQEEREPAELDVGWLTDSDLLLLVERLPAIQRQVITLRYVIGLSNKEIATVIDSTPQAVGQMHYRARRFLADRLQNLHAKQEGRARRAPMLVRLRRMPVLGARRAVLGGPPGSRPPAASRRLPR
jgi:RNA polymerase sigma-70 factor (ECF subfamily)